MGGVKKGPAVELEVRATLPYALRHPECTPTDERILMRMAAECIEEYQKANADYAEALKRAQTLNFNRENSVAEERERCLDVLLKHVKQCSDGKCCDNCNCDAMRHAIAELTKTES